MDQCAQLFGNCQSGCMRRNSRRLSSACWRALVQQLLDAGQPDLGKLSWVSRHQFRRARRGQRSRLPLSHGFLPAASAFRAAGWQCVTGDAGCHRGRRGASSFCVDASGTVQRRDSIVSGSAAGGNGGQGARLAIGFGAAAAGAADGDGGAWQQVLPAVASQRQKPRMPLAPQQMYIGRRRAPAPSACRLRFRCTGTYEGALVRGRCRRVYGLASRCTTPRRQRARIRLPSRHRSTLLFARTPPWTARAAQPARCGRAVGADSGRGERR